jgi:CheY-like chemotaxis protein
MARQGRILILDDLRKWREQLVEMLKRNGFYADSVATAAEALEVLNKTHYHVLVLDIRMDRDDPGNKDGIILLGELDKRGLSEAIKVIILSAYGTQERMRLAFKDYKVVDFLSKDNFNNQVFLECLRQVFSEEGNINLALEVHWQHVIGPEQLVLNLDIGGTLIKEDTSLQRQMAEELDDLLCRLFYQAKSILVRPLTAGRSGTGVLRIQPFYTTGGGGHEVVVKFGYSRKIEQEYYNFKHYVQPFLGGGRNTMALDMCRTPHFGGIIYSLLGSINDQLVDFGEFYHHADVSKIKEALNRLFWDTCSPWYANRGNLQPLNLTEDYQRLFEYSPEMLEQVVVEQLQSVQGKQKLSFKSLRSKRIFTNPIRASAGKSLALPTYLCITHGDFNPRNLLVDSTGHMWMIDFQQTGQSHILRDVAILDSIVRFQLLTEEEATLKDRLYMEEALCSIDCFSEVEQLAHSFSTQNPALAKTYETVVHLRTLAFKLVEQNIQADINEYYIALLYNALNTLQFFSLSPRQREHALLCASLLVDRLGLSS